MGMPVDQIPIVEEFLSFQGEGRNLGVPYYFIRVGGCPLRCNFCDSERTWKPDANQIVPLSHVIGKALHECKKKNIEWISVTGGEPLLYPEQCCKIIAEANAVGIKTHIETSGRFYDHFVHYECSLYSVDAKTPCTGETMIGFANGIERLRPYDQIKCLIDDVNDFDYAYQCNLHMQSLGVKAAMVLQPFNKNIFTKSTKHMNREDIAHSERIWSDGLISKEASNLALLEKLHWMFEKFKSSLNKGWNWKNVLFTPQSHVLVYGNIPAT